MLHLAPVTETRRSERTRSFKPFEARDCSECPCAWEDRSYEGDCDCGCVASGSMTGKSPVCFLPRCVKRLIRKLADARRDRALCEEYDGIAEWFAESERKDEAMRKAIMETFPGFIPGHDGPGMLRMRYEENLKEKEDGTEE